MSETSRPYSLKVLKVLRKMKKTFLQNRNNVSIDMLKDITIDEVSLERMTDLKIFRVQTLIRWCETTALLKFLVHDSQTKT